MSAEPRPPRPLVVGAALVGLEGAAAAIAGIGFGVAALAGHPSDRATAVTLAAVLLVLGLGLLVVARGLARQRPASATPAYLAQFFTLVVAYYQRHTLIGVTVLLGVVSVVAVVALTMAERDTANSG